MQVGKNFAHETSLQTEKTFDENCLFSASVPVRVFTKYSWNLMSHFKSLFQKRNGQENS